MFFSEDLLVAKRGSLGIIWLVSTLGPRNKRVTRKALANVEIPRTCELIAEPPEPLALRLSGQLLVGVARVYNQNYEHFYSDVQTFDHALRRSIAINFSAASRATNGGDEIDLPGGGKTRLDLITFGEVDLSLAMFSGLDFEFGHINWFEPLSTQLPPSPRRNTTPLESLRTNASQKEEGEEEEDDDDTETSRSPKRRRITSNDSPRPSFKPNFEPLPDPGSHIFEPMDIFDNLPNVNVPSSDGPMPFDEPDPDVSFDFPAPGDDPVNIDVDGQRTPQAHVSPKRPRTDSSEELSDVEVALVPPRKKPKTRRVKKLTYDWNLEIAVPSDQELENEYLEAMKKQHKENMKKRIDTAAGSKAQVMLDTAGNWVKFLDDDMNLFLAGFTKIRNFKWQMEAKRPANPPVAQSYGPSAIANLDLPDDEPPIMNMDILPDVPDLPDMPFEHPEVPDPEVPRDGRGPRDSSIYPWDIEDSLPGGFVSPGDLPPSSGYSTPIRVRPSLPSNAPSSTTRHLHSRSPSIDSDRIDPSVSLLDIRPEDFRNNDDRYSVLQRVVPTRLVTLELQCQRFLRSVEKSMVQWNTDEVELADIVPKKITKKNVAATAFYNCLTLATKCMLDLSQDVDFGPITIRLAA